MIVASRDTHVIPIQNHTRIADARREIGQLAATLGFDEVRRGKVEIVVTEMATNICLHAREGHILVRTHGLDEGIELLGVDRGPGMTNLAECLRDGFSTAGTAGNGLGAIKRQSAVFDVYTQPGIGTLVLSQIHRASDPAPARFRVGAVCVALAGEPACGDSWTAMLSPRGARIAVADGLGHGVDAAQASLRAMRLVETSPGKPTTTVIEQANRALAATRGAAMSVCDIDPDAGVARFTGVGNVSGAIFNDGRLRSLVCHNGTVGLHIHKIQEFSYPWTRDSLLVMHSDGVLTRWNFDSTPGLTMRHPSIIAAVLRRDFARGRDDVCVVVMKAGP